MVTVLFPLPMASAPITTSLMDEFALGRVLEPKNTPLLEMDSVFDVPAPKNLPASDPRATLLLELLEVPAKCLSDQ